MHVRSRAELSGARAPYIQWGHTHVQVGGSDAREGTVFEHTDTCSINRWTGGWTDGRTDGRTDRGTDKSIDGWIGGRTDGWMDGRTDGWKYGQIPTDGRTGGRAGGRIGRNDVRKCTHTIGTDARADGCTGGCTGGRMHGRTDIYMSRPYTCTHARLHGMHAYNRRQARRHAGPARPRPGAPARRGPRPCRGRDHTP